MQIGNIILQKLYPVHVHTLLLLECHPQFLVLTLILLAFHFQILERLHNSIEFVIDHLHLKIISFPHIFILRIQHLHLTHPHVYFLLFRIQLFQENLHLFICHVQFQFQLLVGQILFFYRVT